MISQIEQAKARDGLVIAVATEGDAQIAAKADRVLWVPEAPALLQPVVNVIPLQPLAYHIAVLRGASDRLGSSPAHSLVPTDASPDPGSGSAAPRLSGHRPRRFLGAADPAAGLAYETDNWPRFDPDSCYGYPRTRYAYAPTSPPGLAQRSSPPNCHPAGGSGQTSGAGPACPSADAPE
jgi:hypothetical protein